MVDRFSGPVPRGIKVAALVLAAACLLGFAGLGLFYSLDHEIERDISAGEQSSRGTTFAAYPDLMWRLLMQRKFPRDYGPKPDLARGKDSLCDFFIERHLPRAASPWIGWLAKPFSEHLVTTYIEKHRLMLFFANDWDGPPRGLDHQSIARFGKAPTDLTAREVVVLVLAATGTPEATLPEATVTAYDHLVRGCEQLKASLHRPKYCDGLAPAQRPSSAPSGSGSP